MGKRNTCGSHNIYVGEVEQSWVWPEGGAPLVYWDRGYRRLAV
ncbi:MAG: flavin reductase family protein [Thermoanaerobaculia bacterium]|nr:flavin reductase family protein [Thermoanaerobaculia bacterium]